MGLAQARHNYVGWNGNGGCFEQYKSKISEPLLDRVTNQGQTCADNGSFTLVVVRESSRQHFSHLSAFTVLANYLCANRSLQRELGP